MLPQSQLEYPPGYLEQDRSGEIIGTAVPFIVLLTLFTALRVWARTFQRVGWLWADILIPVSYLFNLGVITCSLLSIRFGAGKHGATMSPSDIWPFVLTAFWSSPGLYIAATTFSKLAVLELYLKILFDRASRWIIWLTGTVLILNFAVNGATLFVQCQPVSILWNHDQDFTCNNIWLHFVLVSVPNIVTDVVILILPIPTIARLQDTWRNKSGVFLTFILGSFGLVTAVIRLIQYLRFKSLSLDVVGSDETWFGVDDLNWVIIEPGVYHLAACTLTFRPLLRWLVSHSPCVSRLASKAGITSNGLSDGWSDESLQLSRPMPRRNAVFRTGQPDEWDKISLFSSSTIRNGSTATAESTWTPAMASTAQYCDSPTFDENVFRRDRSIRVVRGFEVSVV